MFNFLHHNKPANLLFENEYDKVVATRHLPTKLIGQPIDYHKIVRDYMPKGYRFVNHDPLNNPVIKAGANEVIYVKKTGAKDSKKKAKAQPKPKKPKISEIVVRYQLSDDPNHVIRQQITRQPVGHRFNADYYIKNVPVGYQFKQILNGQHPVSKFTAALQHVNIAVVPAKKTKKQPAKQPDPSKSKVKSSFRPKPQRSQPVHHAAKHAPAHQPSKQITDGVLYQNIDDGNIEGTAKISGPRGMKIDYAPYIHSDSKDMPAGFHFDHLATGTGHVLRPHTGYTILIKKNSPAQAKTAEPNPSTTSTGGSQTATKSQAPREVSGILAYRDVNTHQVIKSVPIRGRQGVTVNYGKYMMADQLPAHYHLTGLGTRSSDRFQPNAHYVILVTRNQATKPKKPHYAPVVNGTINYCDTETHQLVDVQQISGPVGLSLDYQRYMPRGYRFLKLGRGAVNNLTPKMHSTVWIARKKVASQQTRSSSTASVNTEGSEAAAHNHSVNQTQSTTGKQQTVNHTANVPKDRRNNPRVLPQDPSKAVNIGTILENLGKSLSALGRAIDHHQL